MEGYLLKEAAGLVTGYKRRYFKLHGHELSYYAKKENPDPAGTVDISGCKVEANPAQPYGFALSGPTLPRVYNLAAESEEDMKTWISRLQLAASSQVPSSGEETLVCGSGDGKVTLKDFDILKVIGRGSFGKVMKVRRKGTQEIYACKALRKDVILREKMVQNTKAEKTILQCMNHPYIVKLHYAFQTKERLYLILDLLAGGELFFHLKEAGTFDLERSRLYAAEIASALTHLHSQDIVYRDLKPENIVLDLEGHAILTDFGLAKTAIPAKQQTYTFCGTPEYIAPEILKGIGHSKPVDWWALGVLLFEMLVGLPPFYSENVNEMYEMILSKEPDLSDPALTPACKDLLLKLLEKEPNKRLSDGNQILRHSFFSPIDLDKLMKREIKPTFVPDLSGDEDKYIDPEIQEETTRPSVYHSSEHMQGSTAAFQGFTYQG